MKHEFSFFRGKRAAALAAVCLTLTACGGAQSTAAESGAAADSQVSAADSGTDNTAAAFAPSGALRLCDPLRGSMVAGTDGCYFVTPREDGNLNICYADYATLQEVPLCSRPDCQHDNDSCASWVSSESLIPALAVIGDKLYILQGGSGDPSGDASEYPYIDEMELDGSNRRRLYQADTCSAWSALLQDDTHLYAIEADVEDSGDAVSSTDSLVAFDLSSGEKHTLSTFSDAVSYVCDASGSTFYYVQYLPKEGSDSFDVSARYAAYDLQTGQNTVLATSEDLAACSYTVLDGTLYCVDAAAHEIRATDLSSQSERVVAAGFRAGENYSKPHIGALLDGRLIVTGLTDSGSVRDVVDLADGSVSAWPLYDQSAASVSPQPVEIVAEAPDGYIVERYNDAGDTVHSCITAADFWAGNANYRDFEAVG